MDIIRRDQIGEYANPGVTSRQLLYPGNAPSARVTITHVTLLPGAANARHTHAGSEQTWFALEGSGELLLADGATAPFGEGDVARFAPGDVHGLRNTGAVPFVYIAVTAPPLDFRGAYQSHSDGAR
jgi:mannose-6-phosphate isomerase-like protein (cupin superfamily)